MHESKEPLYKQLKQSLLDNISKGVYHEGNKIPTEKELSRQYEVSLITVRNAIKELVTEGILTRRQGDGTYVSHKKWEKNLNELKSFTEMCKDINCTPDAKVIKSVIEKATEEDEKTLHVKTGDPIIVIERIRYADSIPVSLEINRFIERYSFLLAEDLNHCSMYDLLKEKYGITFMKTTRELEIIFADYTLATYLGIPKGHPILSLCGVTTDNLEQDACYAKQLIVGDKFKIIV